MSDPSSPPEQFEFTSVAVVQRDALRRSLVSATESVGAVAVEAIADISRFLPRPPRPSAAPSVAPTIDRLAAFPELESPMLTNEAPPGRSLGDLPVDSASPKSPLADLSVDSQLTDSLFESLLADSLRADSLAGGSDAIESGGDVAADRGVLDSTVPVAPLGRSQLHKDVGGIFTTVVWPLVAMIVVLVALLLWVI